MPETFDPMSERFPEQVFSQALGMARAGSSEYKVRALTSLAMVGGGSVALVDEARASTSGAEDERQLETQHQASAYLQLGAIGKAFMCIDELPHHQAPKVRLLGPMLLYGTPREIPAWPADMLGRGMLTAQMLDPWWGATLMRRLSELHPSRAPELLQVSVHCSHQAEHPQARDDLLQQTVAAAAELSSHNPALLPTARNVRDQIIDTRWRLQAQIAIVDAEGHYRPVRELRKLKAQAARELADDPKGLAQFLAKLHDHPKGARLVSDTEEKAVLAAIPNPFERVRLQGELATARKDFGGIKAAFEALAKLPAGPERIRIGEDFVREYGMSAALLGVPYVHEHLAKPAERTEKGGMVWGYADILSRAGHPEAALELLPYVADDSIMARMAVPSIVRGLAARGKGSYGKAEALAKTVRFSDDGDLAAALLMGSARYQSRSAIRKAAAALRPDIRAEALCEVALITETPNHLAQAAEAARQIDHLPFAVDALIHVINTHRVLRGLPIRKEWWQGTNRWAYPSRETPLTF